MMVIAGSGLRESEWRLVIIQLERFKARKFVRDARLSGISLKRLLDRSSECKVFARGCRLLTVKYVSPLSVRLRCRRKRHFAACMFAKVSRFEALFFGVLEWMLEFELPDERRNFGVLLRTCAYDELWRELSGRGGEALLCRGRGFLPSDDPPRTMGSPSRGLPIEVRLISTNGEDGTEDGMASSANLILGLVAGCGVEGEDGPAGFEDLRRRLSMSSRTMLMRRSLKSSMDPRLMVRLRS